MARAGLIKEQSSLVYSPEQGLTREVQQAGAGLEAGAGTESVHPKLQAQSRRNELEVTWSLQFSKQPSSDIFLQQGHT